MMQHHVDTVGTRAKFGQAMLVTLLYALTPSAAQTQTLQPQSREELQRVFGTGRIESAPTAAAGPSVIQPQSQAELKRTFGQTLGLSETIRMMATPDTTSRLQQLSLLTGGDSKSYYAGWHNIALDVTALDHSPTAKARPGTFHQQFGPARAARAMALVHLAMFEAANQLSGGNYTSLIYAASDPLPTADPNAVAAAVTESAFQTLTWLYPGLTDIQISPANPSTTCSALNAFSLREYAHCSLKEIESSFGALGTQKGVALGREVAARIKGKYQNDGSGRPEPSWDTDFSPRSPSKGSEFAVGQWQVDPVSKLNIALGGYWSDVKPMALAYSFKYRLPEANSPVRWYGQADVDQWPSYNALVQYAGEYRLHSKGLSDPVSQDPRDGFFVAQFWAYDGTAGLCAPTRLYNQIADEVLAELATNPSAIRLESDRTPVIDVNNVVDIARFYALINISMNDAAIAAWDSKYYFQFPRPVTAIRTFQKDSPTLWYPVGAQVTNSEDGKNITPPFPAYPSGHATFGGALFGAIRQYINDPSTFKFKYQSDEFNGKNKDAYNYIRCGESGKNPDGSTDGKYVKFCAKREFDLDCAERENADSRVFMGVHWIFDADDGIALGNYVARDVYKEVLRPKSGTSSTVRFSASPGKERADLLCTAIEWPNGWKSAFGLENFMTPDIN